MCNFEAKYQCTKEITAKPMELSYVEHFYKHLKTKLRKSLEHFFLKGKKKHFLTDLPHFLPT